MKTIGAIFDFVHIDIVLYGIMFKALYDYKTNLARYLSFQAGDEFTLLENANKDWFLAQNGFGEIGYIPKNYMAKENVTETEVLKSIDRAIEAIHYQAAASGGVYSHVHRENLQQLLRHRKNVIESYKEPVSLSPIHSSSSSTATSGSPGKSTQSRNRSLKRAAPAPPGGRSQEEATSTDNRHSGVELSPQSPEIPNGFCKQTDSASNTSSDTLSSEKQTSEFVPYNHVISVEKIDCASSPIHIPSKSASPGKEQEVNQTSVDKTDCATSPISSPSKTSSVSSEIKQENQSELIDVSTIPLPPGLGSGLIEEVRRNTGLSYEKSGVAVETLLGHLGFKIPEIAPVLDKVCQTLHESGSKDDVEESSDYMRLQELFTELTARKDDSQQRGWALHEDESIISSLLEELLSILENAKQSHSQRAVANENYECVHNLVQYYQMETRVSLRLLLLRVFGAMCSLDSMVISFLLFSILTTELAEEIQRNMDDVQRSSYVSLVLCMLFSTGEPVPANLHDHLDEKFIKFILDTLESPPTAEYDDQVTDLLVNLVLAFNLHFHKLDDNFLMRAIAERKTVKVLTEKILLLFNRGEDPVKMFDHEPQPPDSVMKFLQDLYSNPDTSGILYTNDAKVLVDIVLRHLIDLSPGDIVRSSHLRLMQLLLVNSDYTDHQHRLTELTKCLQRIHTEEDQDSEFDQQIVALIYEQCPLVKL